MAGWTNSRGQPGGEAPAVTFIVKDRVLGHNPAAALYTAKFYYKRVLDEKTFPEPRSHSN